MLHIQYTGDEAATLGDYRTTKLEVELLFRAKPEMVTEGLEVAFEVGYWMSVGIGIVDAKASSYIYSLELDPSFRPSIMSGSWSRFMPNLFSASPVVIYS